MDNTPQGPSGVGGTISTIVPLVTIIGTFILMALHDIDQSAAIGIIAGMAGLHGGAAVTRQP